MSKGVTFIIFLLITLCISSYYPVYSQQTVNASEVYVPFVPYRVEPVRKVLYPRLLSPVFKLPGENFSIYYIGSSEPTAVKIVDDVFGREYQLNILGSVVVNEDRAETDISTYFRVDVSIPSNVEPGLYDIVIDVGGERLVEPNGLNVISRYKDSWVIGHFGDPHLGGLKGQFRRANRFFELALYTLEALKPDIIIISGDFIEQEKEDALNHIISLLSTLTVPVTTTLGNTDFVFNSKGIYLIEKYFAPDSTVVDMGNTIVVDLDFETGDIAEPWVYTWVEETLKHYNYTKVRIFNSHYPHWDMSVVSEAVVNFLRDMNEQYGITLYLHGHIHVDVEMAVESTGIYAVSASSTAYGKEYNGFKIERVSTNGEVVTNPDMRYDLEKVYVSYSQYNYFNAKGQTVKIVNGKSQRLDLILPLKLVDEGSEVKVEGASISNDFRFNGRRTVLLEVSLSPNEEKEIIVYQGEDTDPPYIAGDVKIIPFKQYNSIRFDVIDEETGVKNIKVEYSEDGVNWIEAQWIEIDSWPYPVIPREIENFMLKITVSDYLGNENIFTKTFGSIEREGEEGGEETEGGFPQLYLALVGILIVIIVISILLVRRRR